MVVEDECMQKKKTILPAAITCHTDLKYFFLSYHCVCDIMIASCEDINVLNTKWCN